MLTRTPLSVNPNVYFYPLSNRLEPIVGKLALAKAGSELPLNPSIGSGLAHFIRYWFTLNAWVPDRRSLKRAKRGHLCT